MFALMMLACAWEWGQQVSVCDNNANCPPVLYSMCLKDKSGDSWLSARSLHRCKLFEQVPTVTVRKKNLAVQDKGFKQCVVFTVICPLGAEPNVPNSAFSVLSLIKHLRLPPLLPPHLWPSSPVFSHSVRPRYSSSFPLLQLNNRCSECSIHLLSLFNHFSS